LNCGDEIMNYKTIRVETEVELIEKRSQFIAVAAPINSEDEAASLIATVRKRHVDANHNCFAYRLFDVETRLERQRYNDDGEPSGTAGMPILNVIKSNELFNCIIIVTRYFGGVMLGAGGLVRAYGSAAGLAVKQAGIAIVKQYAQVKVTVGYDISDKTLRAIELGGFEVKDKTYDSSANFDVLVEDGATAKFCEMLTQVSNGRAAVNIGEKIWATD